MGRELISSNRDNGVRVTVSELFTVNVLDRPNIGVAGAMAGFQYKLPPLLFLRPLLAIRAITSDRLVARTTFAGTTLLTPANYALWFMTLREPDGRYIIKDAPLFQYQLTLQGAFANVSWKPYFNGKSIVDPRQSYIVTTADGALVLPTFEFSYY